MFWLRATGGEKVAVGFESWRDVEIDCFEGRAAGGLDLVGFTMLDQEERTGAKGDSVFSDDRETLAADDEEPLVGFPMAVARAAFT